jgi:hypothetical protein
MHCILVIVVYRRFSPPFIHREIWWFLYHELFVRVYVSNKDCIYMRVWNPLFFEPILCSLLRGFRICKVFLHALHKSWDMVILVSRTFCQGFMFQINIAFTYMLGMFHSLNLSYVVLWEESKYIRRFCTPFINREIWSFLYHGLLVKASCFK